MELDLFGRKADRRRKMQLGIAKASLGSGVCVQSAIGGMVCGCKKCQERFYETTRLIQEWWNRPTTQQEKTN